MKPARILAILGLLLVVATAQAGTIHPALEAKLAQTLSDEPISVIVSMRDQAPIADLSQRLHFAKANPVERHRAVIEALKGAAASQAALKADLASSERGGSVLGYTGYWISNLMVVYALPAEIRRIASRPDVDVVELNFKAELVEPVGQPGPIERSDAEGGSRGLVTPGLRAVRAPEVWHQLGYNGTGRLIASLDTGVDGNHPALASRWRGYLGAHPWQECWLDVLGTGTQFPTDTGSHGTHTTGTMTGLGVSTQDTVGVAWGAKWIACNAINQGVSPGFDQDIVTAYQWLADPDGDLGTVDDVPDVVCNSWRVNEGFGGSPPYTDCDSRWYAVIDNCEAAGVVSCWAAGNEGPSGSTVGSPADRATSLTNAFSVGAVSATEGQQFPYGIASFSSRGPSGCSVPELQKIKPEVAAPGVGVYSTIPGGGYQGGWDGTSMATPHVAGIVALVRQANPSLDVESIKTILMETARDEGAPGEDNNYGWGFVDAQAAVIAATVGFGAIEGHAYNQSWNNAPLAGVKVKILETGIQYTTNVQGLYTGSAAAGTYTVQASLPGFATMTYPVVITSNETLTLDIYLTDNVAPSVTNVSQLGSSTDAVGPYAISATITDPSTVTSASLFVRINDSAWTPQPMTAAGDIYQASIPGQMPGTRIDYYVRATDGPGQITFSPAGAPDSFYSLFITQVVYAYDSEVSADGWQLGMAGDDAASGLWIRNDPVGTWLGAQAVQPEDDHTANPGVNCFVTGNGLVGGTAGAEDVDYGCTTVRSPIFDLSTTEHAFVGYWRWYGMFGTGSDDTWAVDVSNDGGLTWAPLERVSDARAYWQKVTIDLNSVIALTNQVVFRFKACDLGNPGIIEAAFDDFSLEAFAPNLTAVGQNPTATASALDQNRPNPFRPGSTLTTIRFSLTNPGEAKVAIFDATGRQVRTLFQGPMQSGGHSLVWNGLDDSGNEVGAGVYFYRLTAGAYEQSRRMTIVK